MQTKVPFLTSLSPWGYQSGVYSRNSSLAHRPNFSSFRRRVLRPRSTLSYLAFGSPVLEPRPGWKQYRPESKDERTRTVKML